MLLKLRDKVARLIAPWISEAAAKQERMAAAERLTKRYVTIKAYNKTEPEFLAGIVEIASNEPFQFLMHDLREDAIAKAQEADSESFKQLMGVIKGIDQINANIRALMALRAKLVEGSNE